MGSQPIVIERLFDAPVSRVWKAITDKDDMRKWYFDLPEFKADVGFTFQFTGGPSPEKQYVHLCEITEVIPEKRLTYSWRYEGYSGNSFVTFELTKQGNKTLFRLTHTGIETFPIENRDFAIRNFEEGWTQIVNVSLKEYFEKVN